MKILKLSVLVALLVLSPFLLPVSSAVASQPTVQASGNGVSFELFGGLRRTFSFSAVEMDGEVMGNALLSRESPFEDDHHLDNVHVDINCIRVVDSHTLVIGGVLLKATEFLPEGTQEVFKVIDGGEGNEGDFVTGLFPGTCDSEPNFNLVPIEAGNINVRVRE